MSPTKKTSAPTEVVYTGGSDGVVIHFPSGPVEFLHGVPVEVSADNAKSLAEHPDFQPAAKATTPTTQSPKEDA